MIVPFTARKKISLKVRNFNSVKLKVNDVEGNPIEIAAVVVFKAVDSAKALFEVDNYEKFVEIQSETALRHVASKYPYDAYDSDAISLRGHADIVAAELSRLQAHNIVELDDERKAAMINNLMVAIVSDRAANPIINAGSLY